jgi:phage baseplate assembly protein gpV
MRQFLGGSKIRGLRPAIVADNAERAGNPGYCVKLVFPWLNEQETTFWARIATAMAGAGRGVYTLPEVDDQVLVVFEHGDIDRPIVVGTLWSKKQQPVEVNQSGNNNTKLIKSRCGHRVIFDDRQGAESITIVDSTRKNKIILDSVHQVVRIECDGDLDVIAKASVVIHANALKIGTSAQLTGKGRSLLVHSVKTFSLKAVTGITTGGGTTTINVANAAATRVSGSGSGELGGAPPEAPPPQVEDRTSGFRSRAAGTTPPRPAPGEPSGDSLPLHPPLPATSPTPPGEEVPLTTLEVVVVEPDGTPIGGVRFEVVDPGGKSHEGTTNPEGLIRIDGLPAGQCKVSLPDLARDDWKVS